MATDAPVFNINIPVLRKYGKEAIRVNNINITTQRFQRLTKQRLKAPSEESLRKYLPPKDVILGTKPLRREELLLTYKAFLKQREVRKFNHKMKIPLRQKYKIASTDLRNRLSDTRELPNDVVTIVDTDKDFYNVINGRPLVHTIPMFKTIKETFDRHLRIKQEVGLRNDCILNMEAIHKSELDIYNKSSKICAEQAKNLNTFIAEDYKKSMMFLSAAEKGQAKVSNIIYELQHAANCRFLLSSQIIGLESRYRIQQMYGRFLYYLSPPSWRAQHREFASSLELETMGFDLGTSDEGDSFAELFETLQKECVTGLMGPVLYFHQPADLIRVFETLQKQQLHHFTHVTYMAPHAKKLTEGIQLLKAEIARDTAGVLDEIYRSQKEVIFFEERAVELENKFFKILHGAFHDVIASTEVMEFLVHLQFCFERFTGQKIKEVLNADMLTLAKFLEKSYDDYSAEIEALHCDTVSEAIKQCYANDRRKYFEAKQARRELRLFDRLKKQLMRAVTTELPGLPVLPVVPPPRVPRQTRKKSVWPKPKEPSISVPAKRELTDSELDYLVYFTEWTENEDTDKYLHSQPEDN